MRERIIDAVRAMSSIPFFPKEEYAQRAIMSEIAKFADRPERVDWLASAALRSMREWRGVAELRGMYCTRFKPADGYDEYCSVPGFSANDCEAAYIEGQARETDRKMLEYKREQKLLGEAPSEPLNVTPAIKSIGAPKVDRTTADLRERRNRERLSLIAHADPKPIHIPATHKRTPEEHAAAVRELEAQIEAKRRESLVREACAQPLGSRVM
jgi:hypothetical protein